MAFMQVCLSTLKLSTTPVGNPVGSLWLDHAHARPAQNMHRMVTSHPLESSPPSPLAGLALMRLCTGEKGTNNHHLSFQEFLLFLVELVTNGSKRLEE